MSLVSEAAWKYTKSRELAPFTIMHWAQSGAWPDCDTHTETFFGAGSRTLVIGKNK